MMASEEETGGCEMGNRATVRLSGQSWSVKFKVPRRASHLQCWVCAWLNARSASARGVGFALGFSFFVNIQLIGGQTKALDQQNLYSDLYSVYS